MGSNFGAPKDFFFARKSKPLWRSSSLLFSGHKGYFRCSNLRGVGLTWSRAKVNNDDGINFFHPYALSFTFTFIFTYTFNLILPLPLSLPLPIPLPLP
jgi:hypothetical protein